MKQWNATHPEVVELHKRCGTAVQERAIGKDEAVGEPGIFS